VGAAVMLRRVAEAWRRDATRYERFSRRAVTAFLAGTDRRSPPPLCLMPN
jgi:hypothetical protein